MNEASSPRRRGSRWVRLGYGVQRPTDVEPGDVFEAELRAWADVLPSSGVFTGLTAARRHGLWLPPLPEGLPIFVAMDRREVRSVRPQLLVSRHPNPPARDRTDGVPVAPIPDLLLAAARWLGILDLTVLVDSALRLGTPPDALAEVAAAGRRGAPRLRQALQWSDPRSESPWESLLRMLHRAIDVPVVPQANIYDGSGVFLARADLLLPGTQTLHEYDGAGHRDQRQQRSDLDRDRRLLRGGYVRRGYTSVEVVTRPITVLRDCDLTLGRPHDPTRIQAWYALLRDSLFTDAGAARLLYRLGRAEVAKTGSDPAA